MNKHQEALNDVINNAKDWNVKNDSFGLLQELVDRATPAKPHETRVYDEFFDCWMVIQVCPNCGNKVFDNNCCPKNDCRQAIYWNE